MSSLNTGERWWSESLASPSHSRCSVHPTGPSSTALPALSILYLRPCECSDIINQLHCLKHCLVLMYWAVYSQICPSPGAISISDCIICHLLCISIHHTLNHRLPLSLSQSVGVSIIMSICHSLLLCLIIMRKQTFLPMGDCCRFGLSHCVPLSTHAISIGIGSNSLEESITNPSCLEKVLLLQEPR